MSSLWSRAAFLVHVSSLPVQAFEGVGPQPSIIVAQLGQLNGFRASADSSSTAQPDQVAYSLGMDATGVKTASALPPAHHASQGFSFEAGPGLLGPLPSLTQFEWPLADRAAHTKQAQAPMSVGSTANPSIVIANLGPLHGFDGRADKEDVVPSVEDSRPAVPNGQPDRSVRIIASPPVEIQPGSGFGSGSGPGLSETHPWAATFAGVFEKQNHAYILAILDNIGPDNILVFRLQATAVFMVVAAIIHWWRRRNIQARKACESVDSKRENMEYLEDDLI